MTGRHGSLQHMHEVHKTMDELKNQGYRVIDLQGKSPDLILLKEDKLIAVEVLSRQYKKGKGWKKKWTHSSKKKNYDMFDDVLIFSFRSHPVYNGGEIVSSGTNGKECEQV